MNYSKNSILEQYQSVRRHTENICKPLSKEDYSLQTAEFASPPKWQLAHSTWFFECFILKEFYPGYKEFDEEFSFLFNSYYRSKGAMLKNSERGNLTFPTVENIYKYRKYIDDHILDIINKNLNNEISYLLFLGLNHEQQHQELILSDLKYNYWNNPLLPAYSDEDISVSKDTGKMEFLPIKEGIYEIGYKGEGFYYDNEKEVHKQYLHESAIANRLVTNEEYLKFIEYGGYKNPEYWLSDGWFWKKENNIELPLYWFKVNGRWKYFTLYGKRDLDLKAPVSHISFYEANAFADWADKRLPTEFEWEVACREYENDTDKTLMEANKLMPLPPKNNDNQFIGNLWEWTESAYLPYPMYKQEKGALGEYNGKFMVNQKVLRGGSFTTPKTHIRPTYRNFYHPNMRWMFSGIRLAEKW